MNILLSPKIIDDQRVRFFERFLYGYLETREINGDSERKDNKEIANFFNCSISKVKRGLCNLESLGLIERNSKNQNRVIKIIK